MNSLLRGLLGVTMAMTAGALRGDGPTVTVTSDFHGTATLAKCAELRSKVLELQSLMKQGLTEEASTRAAALQGQYEGAFDTSLKQFAFKSNAEFDDYTRGSKDRFEWIDWGYVDCLELRAFILSDRGDMDRALVLLRKIAEIAPASAVTACETGYIFNTRKMFKEAEESYRKACRLCLQYKSQEEFAGLALRGLGFALGELGRLAEARECYEESLRRDPGNRLALGELEYIRRKETRPAGSR